MHLADKNEQPIAGLHKSHLSTAREKKKKKKTMLLFDRCCWVPVVGSSDFFSRLPISIMKRRVTAAFTGSFCMCPLVSPAEHPDVPSNKEN